MNSKNSDFKTLYKKHIKDFYKGINNFKKGYERGINLSKNKNDSLLAIHTKF